MTDKKDPGVDLGEFPFPLDHAEESRYLTWIRNHSNYMAVRGLFDYTRAVAVLTRGIAVNLLVLLPYLLGVAVLVAAWEVWWPLLSVKLAGSAVWWPLTSFGVAGCLFLLGILWTLFFPLLTPFFRLLRQGKILESGSVSSVGMRDWYERSFGAFLVGIPAVAIFESTPWLRGRFHQLMYRSSPEFTDIALVVLAVVIALTAAFKLGGAAKKLATISVGAVGLLAPFLIVLYVSDYIVESGALRAHWVNESEWASLLWSRMDGPLIWLALLFPAYTFILATNIRVAAFILAALLLPIPLFYSYVLSVYGASGPLIGLLILTGTLIVFGCIRAVKKLSGKSVWASMRELGGLTSRNLLSIGVALIPLLVVLTYLEQSSSNRQDLRTQLDSAAVKLAVQEDFSAFMQESVLRHSTARKSEDPSSVESIQSNLKALSEGRFPGDDPHEGFKFTEYVSSLDRMLDAGRESESSSDEIKEVRDIVRAKHGQLEKLLGADSLTVATEILTTDFELAGHLSRNQELLGPTVDLGGAYKLEDLTARTRRNLAALASFADTYSFYETLEAREIRKLVVWPKGLYVLALGLCLWLFCWLTSIST